MTALLALALAAAPGCPAALAAAATTPDAALATRAPGLVRELDDAGAGGPSAALAAAAAALGARTPGGGEEATAFRAALARHCALAAAPRLPAASAADRAVLGEVLARTDLSPARIDPWAIRRALLAFWDWIVERLGTQEAERYASLGRALFLGACAGAFTLGVAALRRRRRARRAGAGADAARTDPGPSGAPNADASAALAEEALRRGEAREAVRFALLAALGALERAGTVPRGRALTNGEVVRLASGSSTTTTTSTSTSPTPTSTPTSTTTPSDLALLAGTFDRAVYGLLPVTPEEARAAVERARRVSAAAGASR